MKTALVIGPGFLGKQVVAQLLHKGYQVSTIARSNRPDLPDEVNQIAGDISQSKTFSSIPGTFQKIFFLAAPDSRSSEDYRRVYIEGLKNTTALVAKQENESSFVYSSSTGVYGQTSGETVTENSSTGGSTEKSRILVEAEELVSKLNCKTVVARLSGIYGPGRSTLVRKAIATTTLPDNWNSFTNRIHVQDGARALFHLSEFDSANQLYIVSDRCPALRLEVYNWIRTASDKTPFPAPKTTPSPSGKRCSSELLSSTGFSFDYQDYKAGYSRQEIEISYLPDSS